jgi:hypothetical protein
MLKILHRPTGDDDISIGVIDLRREGQTGSLDGFG